MGRRIYSNLKKAIQYIISIHIPIILIVSLPLILGWVYPNILSPIHIIFLELVMGPTCSIIYENEPAEKNVMRQKPRPFSNTFFNLKELATSAIQGFAITLGVLFIYWFSVTHGYGETITRTMVFIALITSNITLTLVNRSFFYSILITIKYQNKLVGVIICITVLSVMAMLYIEPVAQFFQFQRPELLQLFLAIAIGFISVIWYESVKWIKRNQALVRMA